MIKLVCAVERLLRRTEGRNVTEYGKHLHLFHNSPDNNSALNKCQGWSKGMLQVLRATWKDQENFVEEAAAEQHLEDSSLLQGLGQIR